MSWLPRGFSPVAHCPMQACALNVAGCEIVVTVAAPPTGDVVAAIDASRADIAQLIVRRLHEVVAVDEDIIGSRDVAAASAAKSPPPGQEPAVSDVVPPPPVRRPPPVRSIVAGCSVPPPPPGAPALTEVPPPAPAKAAPTQRPWTAAEARGTTPRDILPARTVACAAGAANRELDMRTRLAKAEEYGRAARLMMTGDTAQRWPSPLPATTPALKNRVWVVLEGPAGIYDRWDSVITAGGNVTGTGVQGFASLTEARAYAAAAGYTDLARH